MTRRSALFVGLAFVAVIAAIPPDPGPSPTPSPSIDSMATVDSQNVVAAQPLTKLQILNIAMFEVAPAYALYSAYDQITAFRSAHQAHRNPVAVSGGCYPERSGSTRLSDSIRTCASYAWRAHRQRPPSTS